VIRVRVDDFPHTKGEPQHTLNAFRDFHRVLSDGIGGKRYLLGVIPGRCTVEDVLMIRNETDVVVGMHGIKHDENELDIHQNEFPAYLSREDVCKSLTENRVALEGAIGRQCYVYMPPRNKIDLRTVHAAQYAGFEFYTSGPETDSFVMKNSMGSWIDSRPPHEYGRSDELLARGSHKMLYQMCTQGANTVLTLHWTWETNIGLNNLRLFLSQIPTDCFENFDA